MRLNYPLTLGFYFIVFFFSFYHEHVNTATPENKYVSVRWAGPARRVPARLDHHNSVCSGCFGKSQIDGRESALLVPYTHTHTHTISLHSTSCVICGLTFELFPLNSNFLSPSFLPPAAVFLQTQLQQRLENRRTSVSSVVWKVQNMHKCGRRI